MTTPTEEMLAADFRKLDAEQRLEALQHLTLIMCAADRFGEEVEAIATKWEKAAHDATGVKRIRRAAISASTDTAAAASKLHNAIADTAGKLRQLLVKAKDQHPTLTH